MKTLVLIPAYNAADTIVPLIEAVRSQSVEADVLVVDDGSSDGTAELVEKQSVICLRQAQNQGKGAALRRGFGYAVEHEYKLVVTLDSDLQHDPAELPTLLAAVKESGGVVIGRRERRKPMPWQRRVSNYLVSQMTSWAAGQRLPDAQCGYRVLPVSMFRQIPLSSKHYEMEMELLIKAGRAGYKIDSIPIKTVYTGSQSSIRPSRDTIRFLLMLIRSLFW